MRTLMWFREQDLRIEDNTALFHAIEAGNDGILAVFIVSLEEWKQHDVSPLRQEFILNNIALLKKTLRELNIPLWIEQISRKAEIPAFLLKIAQKNKIVQLYFNEQYELNESRRDEKIIAVFASHKISVKTYTDQVIFQPSLLRTQTQKFFTVFTPFKNAFLARLKNFSLKSFPAPKTHPVFFLDPKSDWGNISMEEKKESVEAQWPAGEKIAQQKLNHFIAHKLKDYAKARDFPSMSGTSGLSPYLASGVISIRTCFLKALSLPHHEIWLNELIWREFYKYILKNFPRVSMHKPFKLNTEKVQWINNEKHFEAWKKGETGIPLVDSGMRQLLDVGWMHNRLRMVTAMFLTKNLLTDWRWGEKHFMQHLIDGDLAANNGGWQWCASTGTDAAPYFRIFNPVTQATRFDPHQEFIKKYCPEYLTPHLPKAIVDLKTSRQRAIDAFKRVL